MLGQRRNSGHSVAPCMSFRFAAKCGNEESVATLKWGSLESLTSTFRRQCSTGTVEYRRSSVNKRAKLEGLTRSYVEVLINLDFLIVKQNSAYAPAKTVV